MTRSTTRARKARPQHTGTISSTGLTRALIRSGCARALLR